MFFVLNQRTLPPPGPMLSGNIISLIKIIATYPTKRRNEDTG
jgi:hypothetical protein